MPYNDERLKMLPSTGAGPLSTQAKADNVRVGMKLLFCLGLSVFAFGNRTAMALAVLSAVNLVLILSHSFSLRSIRRGVAFFFSQTVVIVLLYLIRFHSADALWPGFKISWQLFLAFLPGFVFVETTSQTRTVQALTYVMSHRNAFVISTCLKFLPLLLDEIRTIYEGQVMRGARIRPQDLYKPWNWPDVIHCLIVPVLIHSMKLAGDIALAAKARDFGVKNNRTCWPGE